MPTVNIPPEHFTKNVKNNYSNHQQALIREFLQNSVDAGASKIDFVFDDRTLKVSDNGCGMTSDILVSALLTMSGSHKGSGSIGGFGAAKEILLFQHASYKVITRKDGITTCVIGNQLNYEFVDNELDHDGTIVEIVFHDDYGNLSNFQYEAISYLRNCETIPIVTWNNQEISGREKGELLKEFDWANIYVKELNDSTDEVFMRINGVLMFKQWVSETPFEVIVEITKPSLEILTVNRDSFTYLYSQQLSKLIYDISVEKNQFGKAYGEHKVWRGRNNFYDDLEHSLEDILENNDAMFDESQRKHIKAGISKMVSLMMEKSDNKTIEGEELVTEMRAAATAFDIPEQLIDNMIERAHTCKHNADFFIKVAGKGFDKIPDNLKPDNWGKRTQAWARLWKHCIRLVMRANGIDCAYTIGWVIDNDEKTEAMWQNLDGINIFYMNPMLTWMRSSNHMHVFHKMLMNACHEVTHMDFQHHNESFIIRYEDMLHRTLCMINKSKNSWWKEYLASKKEVI